MVAQLLSFLVLWCTGMKIVYVHDDTETLQDSFTMQLTDGKHSVRGTAWVRILPVNDEKPQLIK